MAKGKAGGQRRAAPAAAPAGPAESEEALVGAAPKAGETGPAGEAEKEKGPDNNKRLAFLEERVPLLHAAVFGLAGRFAPTMELAPASGEDPVDADLRLIGAIAALDATPGELAAVQRADTIEGLAIAFGDKLAAVGLEANPGENAYDLASRAITTRGAQLEAGSAERSRLTAALIDAGYPPHVDEFAVDCAIRALADMTVRLATAIAPQAGGESQDDARKALTKAAKKEVDLFGDLPDTAAITLRFGESNAFIPSIPPRDIERSVLKPAGAGRATLNLEIGFPPEGPPVRVTHAWLIAGGKSVSCEIPGGMKVGGGAQARIPAGYLVF